LKVAAPGNGHFGTADRDRVVAIFEKHRQLPGAPYDEECFLDYLLAAPRGQRAVYGSFSGLRRFNQFIDELQLELGVCFSVEDREAHYSLPRFVARVDELKKSPRSSLRSLGNQLKHGVEWNFVIVVNIALIGLAAWARPTTVPGATLIAITVLIDFALARFYARDRKYKMTLLERLRQKSI